MANLFRHLECDANRGVAVMTAQTSERLAQALEAAGLTGLARRARDDEFHDFLSPHDMPSLELLDELGRALVASAGDLDKALAISRVRQAHKNGDFDADLKESDDWAKSEEGQEALRGLVRHKGGES
jgi:hypothetical protein